MRSSPVARSPLTVNTNTYDIRRASSPRNFTASPSPRLHSESPIRTFSSSTSANNSKLNSETYRVTKHTYKSSINHASSPIPSTMLKDETVEYSPLTTPVKPSASRRDSWDVLNKTKHMFSNDSFDSITNLNESSNSRMTANNNRSSVDSETNSNTKQKKYSLSDSSFKERSEKFVTKTLTSNDYDYASKFVPINETYEGAKGIKVTNKPDGYLGQPFEFESELAMQLLNYHHMMSVRTHIDFSVFSLLFIHSRRITCWKRKFGNFGERRSCHFVGASAGQSAICGELHAARDGHTHRSNHV